MDRKILCIVLCLLPILAQAQEQNYSEKKHHFIEMFRPLYLTTGLPLMEKPSWDNSDVKFQLSFEIPLWRDIKGSGIDILVSYTQISIWNFYAHSSPFFDNTYIPGIYMRKVWREDDGFPLRTIIAGAEHRSNGRDDAYSRSLNYALVGYSRSYRSGLVLQANLRIGPGWWGDVLNWELPLKYYGLLQMSATYTTPSRAWEFVVSASPLWNRSIANVNAEIARRIGRKHNNPYVFIQFHYGYDEALRECMDSYGPVIEEDGKVPCLYGTPVPPRAMLRFGILITPHSTLRGNL